MSSPRGALGAKRYKDARDRGVVRVSALAVALGMGAAVFSMPATAAADTNGSSGSLVSNSPSSSKSKATGYVGPRLSIRSAIRAIREATGGKSGLFPGIRGTGGSSGADGSSPRMVWTIVGLQPQTALPGDGGGVTNTPNGVNSQPVNNSGPTPAPIPAPTPVPIPAPISGTPIDPYSGWTRPGNLVIPATGGPPVVAASFAPPGAPFVAANGQLVIPGAPAIG